MPQPATTATPLAPQAAPKRRDPEGRRRTILSAAAELIVESGAAALTHRAVAARAQVPLGSTTQYFGSIDELREAALQQLSDEIDEELANLEPFLSEFVNDPDRAVAQFLEYLHDTRVLQADIALMTTGVTDPRLRPLALRWFDRLTDMLAQHIGRERAAAIAVYLDGATMHAGLHEQPLEHHEITRALRALATMPVDAGPPPSASTTQTTADPPQERS
ncbi:TetR/AcrR family transcriptional regulator [Leucobacter sp. wl10]|uniref:TetR/AcrR family transcriptional regulator n=1 Tax=Leucobacter sp. wl10 TaxID=2304677 RepID=UPI000E5A9B0F|nr:TetR family transcriptional regulator [Leucobacter sp. wl10]RGE16835.1 TetR family transcriptional regulator [Leucobacter sp. wl10]